MRLQLTIWIYTTNDIWNFSQITLAFYQSQWKNSNKRANRNWRLLLACFHLVVPGKHHYYLNVDRCAFGGNLKLSAQVKGIPNSNEVCGPIIFAVNHNCSAVYYYQDSPYDGWKQYQSVKTNSYLRKFLQCKPEQEFDWWGWTDWGSGPSFSGSYQCVNPCNV